MNKMDLAGKFTKTAARRKEDEDRQGNHDIEFQKQQ